MAQTTVRYTPFTRKRPFVGCGPSHTLPVLFTRLVGLDPPESREREKPDMTDTGNSAATEWVYMP